MSDNEEIEIFPNKNPFKPIIESGFNPFVMLTGSYIDVR